MTVENSTVIAVCLGLNKIQREVARYGEALARSSACIEISTKTNESKVISSSSPWLTCAACDEQENNRPVQERLLEAQRFDNRRTRRNGLYFRKEDISPPSHLSMGRKRTIWTQKSKKVRTKKNKMVKNGRKVKKSTKLNYIII